MAQPLRPSDQGPGQYYSGSGSESKATPSRPSSPPAVSTETSGQTFTQMLSSAYPFDNTDTARAMDSRDIRATGSQSYLSQPEDTPQQLQALQDECTRKQSYIEHLQNCLAQVYTHCQSALPSQGYSPQDITRILQQRDEAQRALWPTKVADMVHHLYVGAPYITTGIEVPVLDATGKHITARLDLTLNYPDQPMPQKLAHENIQLKKQLKEQLCQFNTRIQSLSHTDEALSDITGLLDNPAQKKEGQSRVEKIRKRTVDTDDEKQPGNVPKSDSITLLVSPDEEPKTSELFAKNCAREHSDKLKDTAEETAPAASGYSTEMMGYGSEPPNKKRKSNNTSGRSTSASGS